MILSRDRPEIPSPPEHPPACCTQQTITIPPQAGAKTRQKHHYPGTPLGGVTGAPDADLGGVILDRLVRQAGTPPGCGGSRRR